MRLTEFDTVKALVAHRAGASLRQLAEASGLDRKTVTAIVGARASD